MSITPRAGSDGPLATEKVVRLLCVCVCVRDRVRGEGEREKREGKKRDINSQTIINFLGRLLFPLG